MTRKSYGKRNVFHLHSAFSNNSIKGNESRPLFWGLFIRHNKETEPTQAIETYLNLVSILSLYSYHCIYYHQNYFLKAKYLIIINKICIFIIRCYFPVSKLVLYSLWQLNFLPLYQAFCNVIYIHLSIFKTQSLIIPLGYQ